MKSRMRKKKVNAHKKQLLELLATMTNSKITKVANRWGEALHFTSSALPGYLLATDGEVFWGDHEDCIDKFRWGKTNMDANSLEEFVETFLSTKENYWKILCELNGIQVREANPQECYRLAEVRRLKDLAKKKAWLRSAKIFEEYPTLMGIGMRQCEWGGWSYEVSIAIEERELFREIVDKLGWGDFKVVEFPSSFADSSSCYWDEHNPTLEIMLHDGLWWGIGKDQDIRELLTI